jgi:methionine-rich copper-binding protein CopC
MSRIILRATIPAIVAASCLVAVRPPSIAAHAAFVTSRPAPDSDLAAAPALVSVTFSQSVSRSGTAITVIGPDGSTASGATAVNGAVASTAMRAAGSGTYLVRWANVSIEDGHAANGSFNFTVAGAASAAVQPDSRPARQPATTAPTPRQAAAAALAPAPQARVMPRSGTGAVLDTTLPVSVRILATPMLAVAVLAAPALVRRRTRR